MTQQAQVVEPVQVEGVALTPIEHRGQRVVTLAMVDEVHKRPEDTAGRNFRQHKHRLVEGEDYHKMSADEFRRRFPGLVSDRVTEDLTLLTETGYLMLVKSFRDDLAWKVQRKLVTAYFVAKAAEGITLGQIGGVVRGVTNKALDTRLDPVERAVLALAEKVRVLTYDPQAAATLEFRPAIEVLKERNVPQKGRRRLSQRVSTLLRRYCLGSNRGDWIRLSRETGRHLYHVDAVALWLASGGEALIADHKVQAAGQGVLHFPRRPRKPSSGEGA